MADLLKVMIVDDSALVLTQLERILQGVEGVEVVAKERDGACAVRSAAHFQPDLVLMDIVMPNMDGLSALRVIRSMQPDTRVAMVSSVAGSGSNAEEAFRLGAVQVIGKPFEPEQISALVEHERGYRARSLLHGGGEAREADEGAEA